MLFVLCSMEKDKVAQAATATAPTTSNRHSATIEQGDAPKTVTKIMGPVFFYTNQTAAKYQEFQVILLSAHPFACCMP